MKKFLPILILLAGIVRCTAPIPYLVNSNGIATNATFVASGDGAALTINDANAYAVNEVVINPNINTADPFLINSLSGSANPWFAVSDNGTVTANIIASGGYATLVGTPAWSLGGGSGGGSFLDNQLIVTDGNGDLSVQSISAAYASSFDGGGITTDGSGHLTVISLIPTLGNVSTFNNVFIGANCGNATLSGCCNIGEGSSCLLNLTSGTGNVGVGNGSGDYLMAGSYNTCIGDNALQVDGSSNIVIGANSAANFTGGESFDIEIGNAGVSGDSKQIRIGTPGVQTNCTIAGVINGNGGGLTNLSPTALSPVLRQTYFPTNALFTNNYGVPVTILATAWLSAASGGISDLQFCSLPQGGTSGMIAEARTLMGAAAQTNLIPMTACVSNNWVFYFTNKSNTGSSIAMVCTNTGFIKYS